jgi:hypothetical protein
VRFVAETILRFWADLAIGFVTFHTRGSGGLSVGAGREEQPRGRQAVALLRLSGSSSLGERDLGQRGCCFAPEACAPAAAVLALIDVGC